MTNVKNKMYDYEVTPPAGIWESIAAELDNDKVVVMHEVKGKSKLNFSLAVAATVTGLIFCLMLFKNNFNTTQNSADENGAVVMKIPENENNSDKKNNQQPAKQSDEKNIAQLTKAKNNSGSNTKSYVTIAGPEGQPVKVSSKVATLIEASDENNPSKKAWSKKIHKWKDMMLTNTLAPTPGNFLDIVELNNTLIDKNTN